MAKGRSRQRRSRRDPRRSAVTVLLRWSLHGLVISTCLLAGYVLWLDVTIERHFAGPLWDVPGRIYAAPDELHVGRRITLGQLQDRLGRLGYRQVPGLGGPGRYETGMDRIRIHTRAFVFRDGTEPERVIEISLRNGVIGDMHEHGTGRAVPVLRLEPELIGRLLSGTDQNRMLLAREEIPPILERALVAVEDRDFFSHRGLDGMAILRALWVNLREGAVTQGGSTLTQQLVKNRLAGRERTLARKFREALLAVLLERHFAKEEILWAYVNEVYLGQDGATAVHGFGTAAGFYFGRPLAELSIDQVALLVALVRGASHYNPRRYPERALARRNLVLDVLARQGVITAATATRAGRAPLGIQEAPAWSRARYPAYLELVTRHLESGYEFRDLRTRGLRIFTSLDPDLQDLADRTLPATLARLEARHGIAPHTLQGAMVLLDHGTGDVIALVGGRHAAAGGFNRALDARRPVGSLVKPFIYLAALARPQRFNLLTRIDDTPVSLRLDDGSIWRPGNYDGRAHGEVTLLEALARSYNLAAVRVGMEVGVATVAGELRRAGLGRDPGRHASLLLGAVEMSPLEVGQVYQTLANGGFRIPLGAIRNIVADDGRDLEREALQVEQALDPAASFLVSAAMDFVTREGTAAALGRRRGSAGSLPAKTGSTNDLRDAWFVVFGERMLAVIWVGRDDNRPAGLTGAGGAMPVFTDLLGATTVAPYAPVVPGVIRWSDPVRVPFAGNCRAIGPLPYMDGHPFPGGAQC